MTTENLIANTVSGMGYELVDFEMSPRGRTLRVFIDRIDTTSGIDTEDCARVSNQLSRLFEVENIDYDRLEISSPGLDRVVKKETDFIRFAGESLQIKLRLPLNGRRNFQGILQGCVAGVVSLQLENETISFELAQIEKARLVPRF